MVKSMKKWQRDFALGSSLLIVAIVVLIYSYMLDSPRTTLFLARPDTYMALWLVILGMLSVLLMIRAWKSRETEDGNRDCPVIWNPVGVATVCILVVYLLVLKKLGFILSSTVMLSLLFTIYSLRVMEKPKEIKQVLRMVIFNTLISAVLCVLIYYLFTMVLSTKLPKFNLF